MQRFNTLLLREWMQHRTGWLVLMTVPFVLALLGAIFGDVKLRLGAPDVHVQMGGMPIPISEGALPMAVFALGGTALLTVLLVWMANLLQAPGLARRDQQDRSIEFWLSLPAGHVQSLGATLLMHLVLMPVAAMLAGLAGGAVVALVLVVKVYGLGALASMPWLTLMVAVAAGLARSVLGLMLATLWLSPMILGTMAASAWLKRWGLPAVIGGTTVGHLLLSKVYGITILGDTITEWMVEAGAALGGAGGRGVQPQTETVTDFGSALRAFPIWAMRDGVAAIEDLASPLLLAGLAIAALSFALLLVRRQRGA